LAGTLFFPSDQEPHPGILVLGGSGGGLMWADQMAALLASHGYAALALAYFAYEQLPPALVEIPLEYFETALGWMQTRDAVFRDRLAVMGASRGGELALLLGATFRQIRAVVAYAPSHVVFGDFQAEEKPSWSHCGKPLPFIQRRIHPDLVDESLQREPVPFLPWFLANYDFDDPVAVSDAVIAVERTNGPILLISGQDDQMWPSALMAQKVIERLDQHDFPFSASHLSYPGAGHWLSFPYLPVTVNHIRHPIVKILCALGGSPRDHCRAQADSWMKMCRFLEENLSVR